jgi:hypothetical protein
MGNGRVFNIWSWGQAVRKEEERRQNDGRQCCITKIYRAFLK